MIFYPLLSERPDKDKEQLASASGAQFLELVDAEKYAESWDNASVLLQEKITREEWSEKLAAVWQQTGPVVTRTKKKATYSTKAQDSPEGEYIVLIYASQFARQAQVTETVTVTLDADGRWRVAGYFLQ